jgi:hypothetical protein
MEKRLKINSTAGLRPVLLDFIPEQFQYLKQQSAS